MNTRTRILELLQAGQLTQRQLAQKLGKGEATISYHIKKLMKEGRIVGERTTSKFLNINSNFESSQLSKSRIGNDKPQANAATSQSKLRCHRLKRSYPCKAEIGCLGGSIITLNNNQQEVREYEGATLRLTTKHLIIEGLELYGDMDVPAPQLLLYAERMADGIAGQAAQHFAITLNAGKGSTSIQEIGITQNRATLKRAHTKGIIPLYYNPTTNAVEAWGDMSLDVGEVESDKLRHAETLRENFKPILEKEWGVREQLQYNAQQQDIMAQLARIQEKAELRWQERVAEDVRLEKDIRKHLKLVTSAVRRIEEDYQRRLA